MSPAVNYSRQSFTITHSRPLRSHSSVILVAHTRRQPPTTSRQPPASRQSSVISHQSPVVSHQPPAANRQSPIVCPNRQSLTASRQPSTASRRQHRSSVVTTANNRGYVSVVRRRPPSQTSDYFTMKYSSTRTQKTERSKALRVPPAVTRLTVYRWLHIL